MSNPRTATARPSVDLAVLACRLAVGGIFVYASLDKIADPAGFAVAIANYRMLPYDLLHPVAMLLPWLEAICGVALILGLARRGSALLCGLMTAIFIVGLASALGRGLDISCGCFHTDGGHGVGLDLLLRDILLLLLCLPPLLLRHDRWSLSSLIGERSKSTI